MGHKIPNFRVISSAFKHGCSEEDICCAVESALSRRRIGEDPDKWLYIGFDGAGRALEVVTIVGSDGVEVAIHAMKARKKYLRG